MEENSLFPKDVPEFPKNTNIEDVPRLKCRNPNCISDNTIVEWRPQTLQYGIKCLSCGKYTHQPKENKTDSTKRKNSHKKLIKKRGIDYCECCLRTIDEIPPLGILNGHHVIEYKDEGSNENQNIWILCTACHMFIHWMRDYFGHYKNLKPRQ